MGICVSCRRRDRKAPSKPSGGGAAGAAARAKAELLPRRDHLAVMANSISNIKMTNPIKGIVSKHRKRYIKDGFNLDLAYITDRLIAMGFPAEKLEGVYRNHIDEVYRFLEQKHKDHYKIYNLCSERSYDPSKFHERVAVYPFDDHSPPKVELMQSFCADVDEWLCKDPKNVAAVHCKAGKGRTGTMVCCYLLYSGQKATADEALNYYGTTRTHDEKGVTIPSQRRYVEYYAALLRDRLDYRACAVHIAELALSPPPTLNGAQCTLELWVGPATASRTSPACSYEMRRNETEVRMSLNHCTPFAGDVRVELFSKPKMMMRKEKLFHFWFNTYFVTQKVGAVKIDPPDNCPDLETFKLCLNKWQLDDAHKDKQHKLYSPDFKVELIVQKPPERSAWSGGRAAASAHARPHARARPPPPALPPASTPSSSDSSDDEREDDRDDEHWDSGPITEESAKLLQSVAPQLYPSSRVYRAYPLHAYDDTYIEDDDAPARDSVQGKIPKVASDHTISSTDVCDARYERDRACKTPTDGGKKKYLFFKKDSPGGDEDRRTPTDFVGNISKPRLSLGDMRASWREFSDKHFGTEHSKQKKKSADSSTEAKDDS